MRKIFLSTVAVAALTLAGCTEQRPQFSSIPETLELAQQQQQIATPIIIPETAEPAPGSLWQPGSRHFFKDSRANDIGDLVTVIVSEISEAAVAADTEVERTHNQEAGVTNVLRQTGLFSSPAITNPLSNLMNTDSTRVFEGEGDTERSDTLTARIAAVVTQVLPNGYLYIQGKREVVVNYELKELSIAGIVRPEDISANNTVPSEKIAEARIFYAGKGLVDESQAPSYGVRFLDRVMPF